MPYRCYFKTVMNEVKTLLPIPRYSNNNRYYSTQDVFVYTGMRPGRCTVLKYHVPAEDN